MKVDMLQVCECGARRYGTPDKVDVWLEWRLPEQPTAGMANSEALEAYHKEWCSDAGGLDPTCDLENCEMWQDLQVALTVADTPTMQPITDPDSLRGDFPEGADRDKFLTAVNDKPTASIDGQDGIWNQQTCSFCHTESVDFIVICSFCSDQQQAAYDATEAHKEPAGE